MVALVVALFATPILHAGDLHVYVYPDVSPSARAGEVIRNLKSFSGRLANYEGPDTLVVSVTPFFEDAFSGASLQAIMKATGWQAHSVRGFISGHVGKKLGLRVQSVKRDGERVYSLPK